MSEQRNMTLDFYIKSVSMKVQEITPVYVIWQRGEKKAKTKARLLNENVTQAIIEERF